MRVGLAARNLRRYALVPLHPLVWPFAHLLPRRPGLWIFAGVHGYKDNPRYQHQQVLAARPRGVRAVWFAQTREEAAAVRALGHEAVWKRSPRAWWLQATAGVAVLSSGPSELNRPLMGRIKVVQLWHGAPFKKLHADFPQGDVLLGGTSLVARIVDGFVRRATNATRKVDLLPSQSEVVSTRYQSAFQIGPAQTPVIGTPRGDIIGATGPEAEAEARAARNALLPAHLADASRLVLYAPTWRDGVDEAFLADGLDVAALDNVLEELDAAMLIRLHPQGNRAVFDGAGVSSTKRIVLQKGGAEVDVNVLLRAVDCLLTDYSAISVDHALLGRPIVYFMPDLEQYGAGRGTYEPPQAMTGGLECRTWAEVLEALRAALTEPGPYVAAAEAARDRYWSHRDTGSCARITGAILALVGLDR